MSWKYFFVAFNLVGTCENLAGMYILGNWINDASKKKLVTDSSRRIRDLNTIAIPFNSSEFGLSLEIVLGMSVTTSLINFCQTKK